jgi:hypothetical protein
MKLRFLIPFISVLSASVTHSAVVGSTIGGASDSLFFETAGGDPLNAGTLFIGAYQGAPSVGLGISDIASNFRSFATPSAPSGPFGNFSTESFESNVLPSAGEFDFRGQQIYALVIDSDAISSATEFAFFTADSLANWTFPNVDDPGLEPGSDRTDIILNQQNNVLAGSNDVLDPDGPGAAGEFSSIQLVSVPEPSSALLVFISSIFLFRMRARK